MKKLGTALALFAILASSAIASPPTFSKDKVDWKRVSKNLIKAMSSENEGLRLSAMRVFLELGDKVNVKDAVYDVMHVYRRHKNENVRALALATLHKMQSKWSIGFLKIDVLFQENPRLKRMAYAVIRDYEARKAATAGL